MSYKLPRGTHDIFGINALRMSLLEQKAKEIFRRHGFDEIRTPIFEDAALFIRSIGQTTDIVEKEMYVFNDRKGRKLALRPEGTASLARAFIEHRMDISNSTGKFFYVGEMFRYERPQAGRYRQFCQIGAELYGSSHPVADAEVIVLAQDLLNSIGVENMSIHINSLGCEMCRSFFREALVKYFNSVSDLCIDCLRRLDKNPLRLLDCKVDSSKFMEIPQITDYLCKDCRNNFNLLQSLLNSVNCVYTVDRTLVRGLDYYTRTVFEIYSDSVNLQGALAAGGRYDNLVKELGGQNVVPAVGFAVGSERILLAAQRSDFFNNFKIPEKIFVAIADNELFNEAFAFAVKISRNGLKDNKNISVLGPISSKNLTNQLKFAKKIEAEKTIIFAKTEFKMGKILIKNMRNKSQIEALIKDL